MALKGQLSDFNLAEIFQLIAGQQKTGFLVLESRNEMIFVFEKGKLISTRDRRTEGSDPLERYLRAYGFFDAEKWKHIEFVKDNSSLDLTEILLSEKILGKDQLEEILQSLSVEMTHHCMKLKRGRYYFTATQDTPKGVRGRIEMDVQGLLMEGARRLDEEPRLKEKFPSPVIIFHRGAATPQPGDLPALDLRLYELAVMGDPLGKIIRQAQTDSFKVRERLFALCEQKFLEPIQPAEDDSQGTPETATAAPTGVRKLLRSLTFTLLLVVTLLGIGFLRWQPFLDDQAAAGPAAEGLASTQEAGFTAPAVNPDPDRDLRLRQLQDQVVQAVELFRYRHSEYPVDLSLLVGEGLLPQPVYRTVVDLGWRYQRAARGGNFLLTR